MNSLEKASVAVMKLQIIRGLALLISLLLIASPAAVKPTLTDANLAARISSLAVPHAQSGLLSGIILIARDNQILFHRTYGFASWELRVPNAQVTRFGIASLTKPMTEILVDSLVKSERISLDAPVEKYLPGFPKGPKGGAPNDRTLA